MTEFSRFGNPRRFEIAVRWIDDVEPRERCPVQGGWSLGEMVLTVGGHVLTANNANGDVVRWYLKPVADWIAANWKHLLQEERVPWQEGSVQHAATATMRALHRLIDREDEQGQGDYASAQAWRARHSLRAADTIALYPDLFCRRLGETIELSWTARPPVHAPDGFRFSMTPGMSILPAHEVAAPLLAFLRWVVETAAPSLDADRRQVEHLQTRLDALEALSVPDLEAIYLGEPLSDRVASARHACSLPDLSERPQQLPVLGRMDASVLMFGCVRPDLGEQDVAALIGFIREQSGGHDGKDLAGLVDDDAEAPDVAPYDDGYDLAERLLDEMGLPTADILRIDVQALIEQLRIHIVERRLDESMRGVALAGDGYAPAIIVNLASPYNGFGHGNNEAGRRFTLAHELCHILYDRTRARRIAHGTGAWAPVAVEKRANAFAAMLLMPRHLLRRVLPDAPRNRGTMETIAQGLGVSPRALVRHLGNLDMIDLVERNRLDAAFYG